MRVSYRWWSGVVLTIPFVLGVPGMMQAASAPSPTTLAVIRAQQLLARLHYLPVHWKPLLNKSNRVSLSRAWSAPPHGTWIWSKQPRILRRLWAAPGMSTIVTTGALMSFQRQAGIQVTGRLNSATERALDDAWLRRRFDAHGYNYALVDEYAGSNRPETFTLWHNGRVVLRSLTNTGIAQTPTPLGTFPVYLRYYSQTMSGTTPWGTYYNDPGVPYVNYIDGGVAVHGFYRAAYGFPQSLGCIELPIANAAIAWPYMHIGTLVTVVTNT